MRIIKVLALLLAVGLLLTSCNGLEPGEPQPAPTTEYTILTDRGKFTLLLVGQWKGKDDLEKEFDSSGPLIVDYHVISESSISSDFKLTVGKEIAKDTFYSQGGAVGWRGSVVDKGLGYIVVKDSGHFRLNIESHGCRWNVRVGRER